MIPAPAAHACTFSIDDNSSCVTILLLAMLSFLLCSSPCAGVSPVVVGAWMCDCWQVWVCLTDGESFDGLNLLPPIVSHPHTVSHDQTTKKKRSYTPVAVPKVMSVPFFATALFAYEAVEGSELSVAAGEFLTIEEVNESGWCLVRRTTHTRHMTHTYHVHTCTHDPHADMRYRD